MKNLIVLLCLLFSFLSFSHDKDKGKHKGHNKHHHEPSAFEVIPLNSPVKGSTAKFTLKLPNGFEVDKVKVKLVNAFDLKKDQKKFEDINVTNNNQLDVGVSKLPPGFYRLYVTVIDKKSKKEHCFQTKYHDFVRFVIDESMEVPMPDPKIDNATIAGVDKDSNGIPDRIQRYINETYANEPKTKLALKQYATAYQVVLTTVDNREQNIQASFKMFEADDCLQGLVGLEPAIKKEEDLDSKFLNTKERLFAEKKADLNFHGQGGSSPSDKLSLCQFPTE